MTRGYAALLRGNKVINVAYYNSDAYPSETGVEVLTEISKGTFEEYLRNQQDASGDEWCSLNGWNLFKYENDTKAKLRKATRNDDYVYLYNEKSGTVTILNFGAVIYQFAKEYAGVFIELFENDWVIDAFSVDRCFNEVSIPTGIVNIMVEEGASMGEIQSVAMSLPPVAIGSLQHLNRNEAKYDISFRIPADHPRNEKNVPRWRKLITVYEQPRTVTFHTSYGNYHIPRNKIVHNDFFRKDIIETFKTVPFKEIEALGSALYSTDLFCQSVAICASAVQNLSGNNEVKFSRYEKFAKTLRRDWENITKCLESQSVNGLLPGTDMDSVREALVAKMRKLPDYQDYSIFD